MDSSSSSQQRRRGGGGGGGGMVSPSHTPLSTDKSARDLRSGDFNSNSSSKHDKEKGVNVQVIVRCRPLNEDELRVHTPEEITAGTELPLNADVANVIKGALLWTIAYY
ncbi:hypothetical protein OIU76_000450 [Salix suchowensis]|nr:hypothetical protein OIU76_000450 [Salix suchowensis]KAJ6358726.1 hypothetical protein OIU76_000450 [Salix suchowensis]